MNKMHTASVLHVRTVRGSNFKNLEIMIKTITGKIISKVLHDEGGTFLGCFRCLTMKGLRGIMP